MLLCWSRGTYPGEFLAAEAPRRIKDTTRCSASCQDQPPWAKSKCKLKLSTKQNALHLLRSTVGLTGGGCSRGRWLRAVWGVVRNCKPIKLCFVPRKPLERKRRTPKQLTPYQWRSERREWMCTWPRYLALQGRSLHYITISPIILQRNPTPFGSWITTAAYEASGSLLLISETVRALLPICEATMDPTWGANHQNEEKFSFEEFITEGDFPPSPAGYISLNMQYSDASRRVWVFVSERYNPMLNTIYYLDLGKYNWPLRTLFLTAMMKTPYNVASKALPMHQSLMQSNVWSCECWGTMPLG